MLCLLSFDVMREISPLSNDEYEWCSTGDGSLFSVAGRLPACGWILLELSLAYDVSRASAHFYFILGPEIGFLVNEKIT